MRDEGKGVWVSQQGERSSLTPAPLTGGVGSMDGNLQEENLGREFSSSLTGCHAPPVVGRDESCRTNLAWGEMNLAGRI